MRIMSHKTYDETIGWQFVIVFAICAALITVLFWMAGSHKAGSGLLVVTKSDVVRCYEYAPAPYYYVEDGTLHISNPHRDTTYSGEFRTFEITDQDWESARSDAELGSLNCKRFEAWQ